MFDRRVHPIHQARPPRRGTLTLCVALSLLLHLGLASLLPDMRQEPERKGRAQAPARHVHLRVSPPAPEAAMKERPVVKTSADSPRHLPGKADFEGRHASRASGENDAPERRADAPLPSLDGERERNEIVTFDQERQDGELAHEGRRAPQPAPAPEPPRPAPENADKPQATAPPAHGHADGLADPAQPESQTPDSPRPSEGTASAKPSPPMAEGELKLREASEPSPADTPTPAAAQGSPEAQADRPPAPPARPRKARVAVYDPSLAPDAQQPGFRTRERRTRSTGRFVFGRSAALNVAPTARGAYEADIYRRIARAWYAACDEHRGDIIPGSITVSLRLTRSGLIDSMQLMGRSGASLIQQSFSFGAIRRAALPPMPKSVQQELVGELFEMILTFNFD